MASMLFAPAGPALPVEVLPWEAFGGHVAESIGHYVHDFHIYIVLSTHHIPMRRMEISTHWRFSLS
jgi:hypothetical protein